jgi:hypothetical protein
LRLWKDEYDSNLQFEIIFVWKEKLSTNSTAKEGLGTGPNLNAITTALSQWTIVDDEKILRVPEIRIGTMTLEGDATIHTISYRDIFDKKEGSESTSFLCSWFCWVGRLHL